MQFDDPVVGGNTLLRYGIQSADYVPGVSGWRILRNGNVEFSNGTFRGQLIAGGGKVSLDSNGLHIVGLTRNTDIFSSGVIRIMGTNPTTGEFAQLQQSTLFFHIVDPSPVNGSTSDSGFVNGQTVSTVTNDFPDLVMASPAYTGKARARIILQGQTSASATDDSAAIIDGHDIKLTPDTTNGGAFYVNDNDMGQGVRVVASSGTDSANIGTTETVILTTTSKTYKANRAYIATISGGTASSTTTGQPTWRLRKGINIAGQFLAFGSGNAPNTTATATSRLFDQAPFICGPSDVTTQLALTLQGGTGFVVNHKANQGGRFLIIQDIGNANDFPDAIALT